MRMKAVHAASKCFRENRDTHADTRGTPEKWNLYHGLSLLAEALAELDDRLHAIEQQVESIRTRTRWTGPRPPGTTPSRP